MSSKAQNPETITAPEQQAPKTASPPKPAKDKGASQNKPPKPAPPKTQLHALHAYPGTVGHYAPNAEGVYDRFTLQAADTEHTVKFPPHFGQTLLAAAQPGSTVSVLGYVHTTPKGDAHLHLARVEAAGQSWQPQPPVPTPPAAAELFEVEGAVSELLHSPKGHLHGVRLAGEAAELRFPPHLGEQLAALLPVGTLVQASGQRRPTHPGEVRPDSHPAPLRVAMLTVKGDTYLVG